MKDDKKKKSSNKPKLVPTLGNLDSIQKSFDKAMKDVKKKKKMNKGDFIHVEK